MKTFLVCRVLGLVPIALAVAPSLVDAQTDPTRLGLVVGYASNEQIWKPSVPAEGKGGVVLGGFLNAATSVGWLSIYVDGTWVQRGGDVAGTVQGQDVVGGLRADLLSFSIRPRANLPLGGARVFIAAGPAVDQSIRVRKDAGLTQVLDNEVASSIGVGFGGGIGATINERFALELEARLFEGLGDAASGPFVSVRNRALEVVGRVGFVRPGA